MSDSARKRVLLSAYACEPDRGSEPGVGWRWANGLASRVDLTVLTRCANREVIEEAVEKAAEDDPIRGVEFIYHDLPKWVLFLKKKKLLPIMPYYILWQWAVCRRLRERASSFDVVHHLTFCSLLCPGFWSRMEPVFVIGPVGAPVVSEHYLPVFGRGALVQRIRGAVMERFDWLPWLKRTYGGADLIVPANRDTKKLLERCGFAAAEVILDTGSPELELGSVAPEGGPVTFLYAGALVRRKGVDLSLRALAKAGEAAGDWRYRVVGDGPERDRLEELAGELGISERVEFLGSKEHRETLEEMQKADVFLFSSVRDTSAGVNLEAMACGLPVICINHQGVGDITNDECAIRVEPGPIPKTIERLAEAVTRMATDEELRASLAAAAKVRADRDFTWDSKFNDMTCHYQRLLENKNPDTTLDL